MRRAFHSAAMLFSLCAAAQTLRWSTHAVVAPDGIAGAALDRAAPASLVAWGRRLWRIRLPDQTVREFPVERFGASGCLWDVNNDGRRDLIVHQPPDKLVWLEAPGFRVTRLIDTEAEFAECLGTTLLGRRGLLVSHRGMQVRFYLPADKPGRRWPYRELYSFYTASYQSGLALDDVDGDGRTDILCGNYWIRSPEAFDLPWRLFAINTWHEQPHSAQVKLALLHRAAQKALLVSQGALEHGRLALFTPPADSRQLWLEQRLASDLSQPAAIAVADFDGDGRDDFVVGEEGVHPRLVWWRQTAGGGFLPEIIEQGREIRAVWAVDLNKDGRPDVLTLSGSGPSIVWHENQPVQ
ncbi:MAG: VCBS repeat-containing protein [Acidobacteria bacterium]|nr:VCBS repeat-containing protein [Acidobacteriota bacterium]